MTGCNRQAKGMDKRMEHKGIKAILKRWFAQSSRQEYTSCELTVPDYARLSILNLGFARAAICYGPKKPTPCMRSRLF